MARKPDSAFRSTSDAQPKLGVDATPSATGGKRKGRRMRRTPSESRVIAIDPQRIAELVAQYGTVSVETRKRGRKRYATLVSYVDESVKRDK